MKKKFILFFIITIFLFIIAINIYIYINLYNTGKMSTITGIDNNLIEDYLINSNKLYGENKNNFKTFYSTKILKTEFNNKKNEVINYSWILVENYYYNNGNIEIIKYSSMPYKFTLYDSNKLRVEYPDENNYDYSINTIFPKDVIKNFPMDNELQELHLIINKNVNNYYFNNIEQNNTIIDNILFNKENSNIDIIL